MKINNKIIFILSVLFCFASSFYAGGTGSTAAEFLNIGVGAKAAALGGAMTARTEGVDSVYWNPAGLAGIKFTEASFSQTILVLGISHTSAGLAVPLGERAALGLQVNYFSSGDLDKVDNTGLMTGTFTARDLSAAICFSAKLTDNLPAGISLKYIASSIEDSSGSAVAVDLGVQFVANNTITLGAGVFNLGTKLRQALAEEALPLNMKAGILLKLFGTSLSADIVIPDSGSAGFSTGAEYILPLIRNSSMVLRAGYNSSVLTGGFSLGGGFILGPLNFDYAFLFFGEIGNNHRFSLKFRI